MSEANKSSGWALVTGASRGIGREIARQLAEAGRRVILTARTREKAEAAAEALRGELPRAELLAEALDADDPGAPGALRGRLEARGARIELLIQNAGIALDGFNVEVVRRTLETNLRGPMRIHEALAPLLAEGGVELLVSSGMGELSAYAPPIREAFLAASSEAEILALAERFERAVAAGTHTREGWPSSAYRVSKACLNAYARVLATSVAMRSRGVRVNAVGPGWVRTDMGGPHASRGVAEGARSVLLAAELKQSGTFSRDGRLLDW